MDNGYIFLYLCVELVLWSKANDELVRMYFTISV